MSEPAQDLDAEQALIGSVLGGYDVRDLTGVVRPADFYRPAHEQIWLAALAVEESGVKVDAFTVKAELERRGEIARVGGAPYLHTCLSTAPTYSNADWLAERVAELAADRAIDSIGIRLQQLAASRVSAAAEKREQAKTWLDELGEVRTSTRKTPESVLDEVLDIAENGYPGGMPTRWPELNRVISGFYPGQLVTIGARPGVGKTIFGGNCATHIASQGKPVYFASLEMSAVELTMRIVAERARVNLQRLRTGETNEDEWSRIQSRYVEVAAMPIEIEDSSLQTVASIRAGAKQLQREKGLGLIVVDYLGLLDPADPRQVREQQVASMTKGLKRLARELGVPVLLLSQLRRPENPDHVPTMRDLRESGAIEQDSDVVILLHWTEEDPATLQLIVDKQRSGPAGRVELQRWGHYALLD